MIKHDFHIHTVFCDGSDSAEDVVTSAIERGFESIGFSAHSYVAFDRSSCMSREGTAAYIKTINELKEKYKGKIKIFLGIEQDFYSDEPSDEYDYVIGSVHYLKKGRDYISIDESEAKLKDAVKKYYGGDFFALCADYYDTVGALFEKTSCDIIGHFDLPAKFNEGEKLFSESDIRYVNAYTKAISRLSKKAVFEVNTGAVCRGYRKDAYPSDAILSKLCSLGESVILSSDSHKKESIGYKFDESVDRLKKTGFKEVAVFSEKGFVFVKI